MITFLVVVLVWTYLSGALIALVMSEYEPLWFRVLVVPLWPLFVLLMLFSGLYFSVTDFFFRK